MSNSSLSLKQTSLLSKRLPKRNSSYGYFRHVGRFFKYFLWLIVAAFAAENLLWAIYPNQLQQQQEQQLIIIQQRRQDDNKGEAAAAALSSTAVIGSTEEFKLRTTTYDHPSSFRKDRNHIKNKPLSTSSSTLHHHHHSSSIICKRFPRGVTASSIWRRHVNEILEASLHPADIRRYHLNWTAQLLKLLPPHVLERGIRSSPHRAAWSSLLQQLSHHLMKIQKINETNHFHNNSHSSNATLHDSSTTPSPPSDALHIAVLDGSVTFGRQCSELPDQARSLIPINRTHPLPRSIRNEECAWPIRLQWLFDMALGKNVVQVHNYAAGGTDTETALPRLQYSLYPDMMQRGGPDMIINAYATNDNYPHEECNNALRTKCLWNRTKYLSQQFIHTSLRARPCLTHQPVIVYMDDYLGAGWNTMLEELQRHEAVQEEFHYYGDLVGHVTTISALSHLVWSGNTTEYNVLATPKGTPHFKMPGHVARAWMVAYAMLQWTVDFCQDDEDAYDDNPPLRRPDCHGRPNHGRSKPVGENHHSNTSTISTIATVEGEGNRHTGSSLHRP